MLYVSDPGAGSVFIFSYPAGSADGQLANLPQPTGLCVDKSGDVWVVESSGALVVKFAHGGKKAIASRSVTGAFNLFGCAVNASTGTLAVTALGGPSGGSGIWVFAPGNKTPKTYTDPSLQSAYFDAYDTAGNLFVDGLDASGNFALFELPQGGSKLQAITVSQSVGFPGGVQWDGQYLAVGDQYYNKAHASAVYQFSIAGSTATLHGTTVLKKTCDVMQFGLSAAGTKPEGTLIAPDDCAQNAGFYNYPSGGAPTKRLTGFEYPVAAVVSP